MFVGQPRLHRVYKNIVSYMFKFPCVFSEIPYRSYEKGRVSVKCLAMWSAELNSDSEYVWGQNTLYWEKPRLAAKQEGWGGTGE